MLHGRLHRSVESKSPQTEKNTRVRFRKKRPPSSIKKGAGLTAGEHAVQPWVTSCKARRLVKSEVHRRAALRLGFDPSHCVGPTGRSFRHSSSRGSSRKKKKKKRPVFRVVEAPTAGHQARGKTSKTFAHKRSSSRASCVPRFQLASRLPASPSVPKETERPATNGQLSMASWKREYTPHLTTRVGKERESDP